MSHRVSKTDEEWRQLLEPEEYRITRLKGTEAPFSGAYWNEWGQGEYHCRCCGADLFESATKFDAGCGWPSFSDVAEPDNVARQEDFSHGMYRIEVLCKQCGAHLGHVFDDGPDPTGQRYCINSASIRLEKK